MRGGGQTLLQSFEGGFTFYGKDEMVQPFLIESTDLPSTRGEIPIIKSNNASRRPPIKGALHHKPKRFSWAASLLMISVFQQGNLWCTHSMPYYLNDKHIHSWKNVAGGFGGWQCSHYPFWESVLDHQHTHTFPQQCPMVKWRNIRKLQNFPLEKRERRIYMTNTSVVKIL